MFTTPVAACPFCAAMAERHFTLGNTVAAAILDGFPLTEGHTLVVPHLHVPDLFQLGAADQAELWALVAEVTARMRAGGADGVNVGLNVGPAAGQTIGHAHVHVIPRRHGDQPDPRGGVRWIFPERAAYWTDR